MKRTLMVILALVMALTLVIGSVSTVSAEKPAATVSATITAIDTNSIHYTVAWDNFAAVEYSVYIYDNVSTTPVSGQSGPFVRKMKEFSYSFESMGSGIILDGRPFTVTLTVIDKKGTTLTASDTWTEY